MASMDGYFYVYNIPVEGGECTMIKQHKLDTECTIQVHNSSSTLDVVIVLVF